MNNNIFLTSKLSTGSMFRRLNGKEIIGEIEFFIQFGFPMDVDGALLTLRGQLN